MTRWDPIGVNGIPEAQGEYDSYLDAIASKLRNGADLDAIAGYLAQIQAGMGLPVKSNQLVEVAELIVGWYLNQMRD